MRVGHSAFVIVDGVKYPATYVGRGKFSRVYRVGDRVVVYTRDDAKELLGMFANERMMHIPEVVRHWDVGEYACYSMPYYKTVSKEYRSAYLLYRDLLRYFDAFLGFDRIKKMFINKVPKGYISSEFVKYLDEYTDVPRSVVRALEYLVELAFNYSDEFWFDFHRANFGVNDYGVLIFRDVLMFSKK